MEKWRLESPSLSIYELEHGSVNLIHSKPTGEDFLLYQALTTANQLTGKKTNSRLHVQGVKNIKIGYLGKRMSMVCATCGWKARRTR